MRRLAVAALGLVTAVSFAACDDPPKPPPPDAAPPPPPPAPPPPPREGCARSGMMDGIEADPTCVVKPPSEDTVRASMKQLAITVTPDKAEVFSGGTVHLTVTIRNTSTREATVWLEASTRATGVRTDWTRVVGIPEPHPGATEVPRLFFNVTTTDSWDRDVDAVPTTGSGSSPVPTPLGIRLRAGAKLTRVVEWFALRIPAPAPMFQDDAGHRFYPKTLAYPLPAGDYGVALYLPFFSLSKEERKQVLKLKVLTPPKLDGGAGHR